MILFVTDILSNTIPRQQHRHSTTTTPVPKTTTTTTTTSTTTTTTTTTEDLCAEVDCTQGRDTCLLNAVCNPENGQCEGGDTDFNRGCDQDRNTCTINECGEDGVCRINNLNFNGNTCEVTPGVNNECRSDMCVDGTCMPGPKEDGTLCGINNECRSDTCEGGMCRMGMPRMCPERNGLCERPENSVCVPTEGGCNYPDGSFGIDGACRDGCCDGVCCPIGETCCGGDCCPTGACTLDGVCGPA